jgi:DNA-binding transcriptional LysR family regulator
MLDANLLQTFLAVSETGGFTLAAERLNSTQSTVSAQINGLEEQVGQILFFPAVRDEWH